MELEIISTSTWTAEVKVFNKQLQQLNSASVDGWLYAAGDLNGDGKAELLLVDSYGTDTTIKVLDGFTLSQVWSHNLGQAVVDAAIADLDRDGRNDAAVVTTSGLVVFGVIYDADNDGLTNVEEANLGTDPERQDSDGDGYSDPVEIDLGSDPTNAANSPVAPTVVITAVPANPTTATTATFSFSSTFATRSFFECALDGGSFATCNSPVTYTSLAYGDHWFDVRAIDVAGADGPVTSYTWEIVSFASGATSGNYGLIDDEYSGIGGAADGASYDLQQSVTKASCWALMAKQSTAAKAFCFVSTTRPPAATSNGAKRKTLP